MELNLSDQRILQAAIEQGIINLDNVQADMRQKEKEEILSKHKYDIWQATDGRWKTYLPDVAKKNGRRLIAKGTKDKLEEVLIDYYKRDECICCEANSTLTDLYPEWIKYRSTLTQSSSTIKRYNSIWHTWYRDQEISQIPIRELTYLYLNQWAHELIKDNQWTRKQYYGISTIIKQLLEYATDKGIIESSPFDKVKISNKLFSHNKKPASNEQVFLNEEQKKLSAKAKEKLEARPWCMTPLMILLNFQLGLRIGELVALKIDDIREDRIIIDEMETFTYDVDDHGNVVPAGFKVVPYLKSEAGYREVYLNPVAKELLNDIRKIHLKYGYYDDGYLFIASRSKKRGTSRSITKYLDTLCKDAGIAHKSSHKIRKTYISSLFDCNVNIDTIREQAGHADETTSLKNYCFDQKDESDKINTVLKATNTRMAI